MQATLRRILGPAARLLPRQRRWRRMLRNLDLDPDALPRPVASPSDRDFIICGCPRSGTTLMAAVLYQPPAVVTVSEPWDGMRLPPAELFASFRGEIDETGRLSRGRLDADTLRETGRVVWTREDEGSYAVETSPDYLLGVKWPAFWRYVDLLPDTRFVVCVRHPAEVISSGKRHGGRLVMGLDYDVTFNRRINGDLEQATGDWAIRRALMYEYITSRLLPHLDRPNVFVARYERWFSDRDGLIAELSAFLGVDLGPGWPAIHEERSDLDLSARELELIATHCPSAMALGYDVRSPSAG